MNKETVKRICKILKDKEFKDYIEEALAKDPEKIINALQQHIRNPHKMRFDDVYGKVSDSKTPLGFLTRAYNNFKVRYELSDYSGRDHFVYTFLESERFHEIFNAYVESDFNFFMKPRFKHMSDIKDIKIVKKGYKVKYIQRTDIRTKEETYWGSLGKAADAIGTSSVNISSSLQTGSLVAYSYSFKYVGVKS